MNGLVIKIDFGRGAQVFSGALCRPLSSTAYIPAVNENTTSHTNAHYSTAAPSLVVRTTVYTFLPLQAYRSRDPSILF